MSSQLRQQKQEKSCIVSPTSIKTIKTVRRLPALLYIEASKTTIIYDLGRLTHPQGHKITLELYHFLTLFHDQPSVHAL